MKKDAGFAFVVAGLLAAVLVGCGNAANASLCRLPRGPALHPSSAVTVIRNVAYGAENGQPTLLDVYSPGQTEPQRPAVLVVHSGGWATGDKSAWAAESAALAKAGFVAFDANYTLATPQRPGWPLQLQELRVAVRWIRDHAATYRVDPDRIGALGGSAGGNLVELLGDDASGPCTQGARVAAVVAWSGPTNLHGLDTAALACVHGRRACGSTGLASLLPPLLLRYFGCSAASCPRRWSDASPIDHVSSDDPPILLFNSAQEVVPLDQIQAFADGLAAAAVPHALVVYPGGAHAEAYSSLAMAPTISFFAKYLTG